MDVMGMMDGGRVFVLLSALSNYCRVCLDLGDFSLVFLSPCMKRPLEVVLLESRCEKTQGVQQPIFSSKLTLKHELVNAADLIVGLYRIKFPLSKYLQDIRKHLKAFPSSPQ